MLSWWIKWFSWHTRSWIFALTFLSTMIVFQRDSAFLISARIIMRMATKRTLAIFTSEKLSVEYNGTFIIMENFSILFLTYLSIIAIDCIDDFCLVLLRIIAIGLLERERFCGRVIIFLEILAEPGWPRWTWRWGWMLQHWLQLFMESLLSVHERR